MTMLLTDLVPLGELTRFNRVEAHVCNAQMMRSGEELYVDIFVQWIGAEGSPGDKIPRSPIPQVRSRPIVLI
jgi:hypothetical protein